MFAYYNLTQTLWLLWWYLISVNMNGEQFIFFFHFPLLDNNKTNDEWTEWMTNLAANLLEREEILLVLSKLQRQKAAYFAAYLFSIISHTYNE